MKLILLGLFASSLLVSGSLPSSTQYAAPASSSYNCKNKFDYIYAEPFKGGNRISKIHIKVSFQLPLKTNAMITIKIVNVNYSDGKLLHTKTTKNQKFTYTYNYDQSGGMIAFPSNTLVFNLTSERGNDEVKIPLKNYSWKKMEATSGATYQSDANIAVYRLNEGVKYISEKFTFGKVINQIEINKVTGIRISDLKFEYINSGGSNRIESVNPHIVLECGDDFKNFGEVFITGFSRQSPLAVKLSTINYSTCNLINVDQFYVSSTSLDMSTSPMEGYQETDYFYFPMNGGFKNYRLRYIVDEIGANSCQFVYTLEVSINTKLFGNCMDSTYCLSTEDAAPNLDEGTIIVH